MRQACETKADESASSAYILGAGPEHIPATRWVERHIDKFNIPNINSDCPPLLRMTGHAVILIGMLTC